MIVEENSKLIEERHTILIKIDKHEATEDDIKRLGEINFEINKNIKNRIENEKIDVPKIKIEKRDLTLKDLRKIRKEKRERYRVLAQKSLELYKELVSKKQMGVELEEKLSNKNFKESDLKILTNEVLRY